MEKTSTGIEENVASMLCYLAGWITGLIFFLIEKENRTVRWHAMQSIVVFAALPILSIVMGFIPFINYLAWPVISVVMLVLWIVLMLKAYQGQKFRVPIAADIADRNSAPIPPAGPVVQP